MQAFNFPGMSPDKRLPEVIELDDHPWYIGVQFHPELKSRPFAPHPLFTSFVKAAIAQARLVLTPENIHGETNYRVRGICNNWK